MNSLPLLTLITLTPLFGAIVVAGLDRERRAQARRFGLFFNVISLALAGALWLKFDPIATGLQFVERHDWIPTLGVQYFVGVDGLGLLMVLLSAFVVTFALLAEWTRLGGGPVPLTPALSSSGGEGARRAGEGDAPAAPIHPNPKAFVSLLLFLQAGLFGAFTALNFFHWFIFWELSLVPAYFLIKLWGGPQRVQAATQFFLYTLVGSVTMLLGMVAVFLATNSFDFIELAKNGRGTGLALQAFFIAKLGWKISASTLALLVFGGVLLGFAVKVPLMPFHTWLPGAYAEAPTGVTMVLTGAMSKMGVYGFLRVLLPVFPEQMRAVLTPLLWLAVLTIVASALAAFAQRDVKRMFAYSSINHLGYCLLGVFAAVRLTGNEAQWAVEKSAALNGVLLQMVNHGITAAALFFFVGLLEQRTGLRGLDDFGGLRRVAPVFCGLMGIALFASLGLPGLNNFVGEFLIFKGAFALAPWAAALSALGLLVTAVFLLTLLQRVWNGPLNERWADFRDLSYLERLMAVPATALMFVIGIWPKAVLMFINPAIMALVDSVK